MEKKEANENSCSQVDLLPGEKRRKRRLSPQERTRLFEALTEANSQGKRGHLAPILVLDLNPGLRRTELLSLKLDDVDFLQNIIRATDTRNGEGREVEMNQTRPRLTG